MRAAALSMGGLLVALGVSMSGTARGDDLLDITDKRGDATVAGLPTGPLPDHLETAHLRPVQVAASLQGALEAANPGAAVAGPVAGRRLQLGTPMDGFEPKLRRAELSNNEDGWRNGASILPPDLRSLPAPAGEPVSNGPSPMISGRDRGGVLGLSYRINPR